MKNVSLALNGLMLIAIAVLFWLHFSSKSSSPTKQINFGEKNMKIAFVDVGKLDSNYKFITEKRSVMEKKVAGMRNSLGDKEQYFAVMQQKLQDEAAVLENDSKISMTDKFNKQKDLQARYEKLQQDYSTFVRQKEEMERGLDDELTKFNKEMMDNLFENINKYNAEQKYDYILAKQQLGGILAANDSLDITDDILKMLNDQYDAQEKK